MAGSMWTEIPRDLHEFFDGSHFIHATRRRLGIVQVQEGCFCNIMEAKQLNPQKCGKPLDSRLVHPTTACEKGPAKNRMHTFIKKAWATCSIWNDAYPT